jgi:hypothetical protein
MVVATAVTGLAATPLAADRDAEACGNASEFRQPYFGLCTSTRFSADAYIFARVGPRDAYAAARGTTIPVVDDAEVESRTATIERPLDFMLSRTAELFGWISARLRRVDLRHHDLPAAPPGGDDVRGGGQHDHRLAHAARRVSPSRGLSHEGVRLLQPGVDCDAHAVSVWQEMQAAAEEAYDRPQPAESSATST